MEYLKYVFTRYFVYKLLKEKYIQVMHVILFVKWWSELWNIEQTTTSEQFGHMTFDIANGQL
jgi:hypothetical protein